MKLLFHPHYPDKEFYTIVPILLRLGYFATTDFADDVEFAMAWHDQTWVEPSPELEALAEHKPVLNLRCVDISKRQVEAVFSAVFGYGSFIDPLQHHGSCVQKHDENAIGGSLVNCPVSHVEQRYVYQKHIDARHGDHIEEFRVPVILGAVPHLYRQRKQVPELEIKTATRSVDIAESSEVFSSEEAGQLVEFSRRLGLDFGELDVLRDNGDGRIYVLDANKTPGGLGMLNRMNWLPATRSMAIERLAKAFEERIGVATETYSKAGRNRRFPRHAAPGTLL